MVKTCSLPSVCRGRVNEVVAVDGVVDILGGVVTDVMVEDNVVDDAAVDDVVFGVLEFDEMVFVDVVEVVVCVVVVVMIFDDVKHAVSCLMAGLASITVKNRRYQKDVF